MRQDFFEYVPQFKLLISGNHKPKISSVDEAIRRRVKSGTINGRCCEGAARPPN